MTPTYTCRHHTTVDGQLRSVYDGQRKVWSMAIRGQLLVVSCQEQQSLTGGLWSHQEKKQSQGSMPAVWNRPYRGSIHIGGMFIAGLNIVEDVFGQPPGITPTAKWSLAPNSLQR